MTDTLLEGFESISGPDANDIYAGSSRNWYAPGQSFVLSSAEKTQGTYSWKLDYDNDPGFWTGSEAFTGGTLLDISTFDSVSIDVKIASAGVAAADWYLDIYSPDFNNYASSGAVSITVGGAFATVTLDLTGITWDLSDVLILTYGVGLFPNASVTYIDNFRGTTSGAGGDASVSLTGTASTGQSGSLTATGAATRTLTGSAASGQSGTVTTSGTATRTLTGASGTGQAGTLTLTGSASVSLTGAASTGQAGNVSASAAGNVNVTLGGVSATVQAGVVTASAVSNATINLIGMQAAASAGAVTADAISLPTRKPLSLHRKRRKAQPEQPTEELPMHTEVAMEVITKRKAKKHADTKKAAVELAALNARNQAAAAILISLW